MKKPSHVSIIVQFILLVGIVIASSAFVNSLWGGAEESLSEEREFEWRGDMTLSQFAQTNNIPRPVMKEVFSLETPGDLQKKLSAFEGKRVRISRNLNKALALSNEEATKNWIKIRIKFGLWFLFLVIVFILLRKKSITPVKRRILYLCAIVIFGIILGSDPSPMGTVKDAIALYGAQRVIFKPRLVAMFVFLAMVFLANKFICAWGCQLGVLQDMIFRLNRNIKDTRGALKQYKIPFVITNTIRIIFFLVFTGIAFLWGFDLVDKIDPFRVYKPLKILLGGWVFLSLLLLASLFVYRPWCHLFCPFGLIGWIVEKISLFKIKVDYNTCIECQACAKACPSTVMEAILKQDRVIPDCFACSTCVHVCPTNSINLGFGKRTPPPPGKFEKKPAPVSETGDKNPSSDSGT